MHLVSLGTAGPYPKICLRYYVSRRRGKCHCPKILKIGAFYNTYRTERHKSIYDIKPVEVKSKIRFDPVAIVRL